MSTKKNAGVVTAYGAAVQAGYEGSYEDFCAAMADLGIQVGYLKNMTVTVNILTPSSSASARRPDAEHPEREQGRQRQYWRDAESDDRHGDDRGTWIQRSCNDYRHSRESGPEPDDPGRRKR